MADQTMYVLEYVGNDDQLHVSLPSPSKEFLLEIMVPCLNNPTRILEYQFVNSIPVKKLIVRKTRKVRKVRSTR